MLSLWTQCFHPVLLYCRCSSVHLDFPEVKMLGGLLKTPAGAGIPAALSLVVVDVSPAYTLAAAVEVVGARCLTFMCYRHLCDEAHCAHVLQPFRVGQTFSAGVHVWPIAAAAACSSHMACEATPYVAAIELRKLHAESRRCVSAAPRCGLYINCRSYPRYHLSREIRLAFLMKQHTVFVWDSVSPHMGGASTHTSAPLVHVPAGHSDRLCGSNASSSV